MAKFTYSAMNAQNKKVTGALEAKDRAAATALLSKQKLRPVGLREESTRAKAMSGLFKGKVKSKELVIFTRQLSTMVSAGVPLLRALNTLGQQSESKRLQEVLTVVNKDVQGGMSLGDAFAKHPKVFNEVYVNMVRAGEAGGILDEILKRLALQQEKSESIRKKVKGAMTYPIVLLTITVVAFIGLMVFIVPRIGQIVKDLGGPDAELPPITQAMLAISSFMTNQWYILIGLTVGGIFLFRRWVATPEGKRTFNTFMLKVPAIGTIISKLAVARFSRTFASLLGAGVSVVEALKVSGGAVGNSAYKEALDKAAEGVKNGKQLSVILSESNMFPMIVSQMLAVGEETGQTDTILIKVAEFYEEEVDTLIGSLSSILEPVMIVIMGSMIGLIAASVMGPISSLSTNIKG
ncbi:MAG TPA: type II secretion system F family protein [Candidatus Saccharimonadales bacterium]|nr:type II secretion system F family protein [Candidatus Saccharimonadales bacterium]